MLDNVTAAIATHAKGRPEHPAIIHADSRISYAELETRLQHTAGFLKQEGMSKGRIVGLLMHDTIDHLVYLLALLRLGCVVMPMDVRWTDEESGRVLRQFDVFALVTDDANAAAEHTHVKLINTQTGTSMDKARPVSSWDTDAGSPAFLSLTSGTTGIPKGALLRHGLYITRVVCESITIRTTPDDVNMCATPLHFGAARNITLCNLFFGATVVLFPPPYSPEELVAAVARFKANTMYLVPTLIRRLLALAPKDSLLFEGFRMLMCGGAIIHPEEWHGVRTRISKNLLNIYATSEAGCISCLPPEADARYAESVGRPAFLTDVEIVDERDQPLPVGTVGRIRYRSPQVPEGYYNNPEESAASFRKGWYYPSDLGRVDAEGYLYIVGRSKEMIIRGGINIYPAEIESVLLRHENVAEAAVIGWPSREFGEEIAAFVLPRAPVDESELLQFCRTSLARYKVPRKIFFINEFPRTSAGKILKTGLAQTLPSIP